jgi:methylenetetrahydrofolate reductase (NADPH)
MIDSPRPTEAPFRRAASSPPTRCTISMPRRRASRSSSSPPKTPEMEERLWEVVKRLEPLAPRFVSVTYGAGGSTRERTHAHRRRIREETALSRRRI